MSKLDEYTAKRSQQSATFAKEYQKEKALYFLLCNDIILLHSFLFGIN